jgi:DNA-binding transcriptional MerR regulator
MVLKTDKPKRLYYSIKEVAEMVGVAESTLRYWEKEFPNLHPKTVAGTKVRQYSEDDIKEVKVIYNLIKVRGFKIANARRYLRENKDGADRSQELLATLITVRDKLQRLKSSLDTLV